MTKRYLHTLIGALLTLSFAPFLSASDVTDWIAPEVENKVLWGPFERDTPEESCMDNAAVANLINGGFGYILVIEYLSPLNALCWVNFEDGSTGTSYGTTAIDGPVAQCKNPDYNVPEDLDDDGDPDHCHTTLCSKQNDFYLAPDVTGITCVQNSSGEYCEYSASQGTTESGETMNFIIPSGESCYLDENGEPNDIFDPDEDNEIPDPNDPNTPPTNDGNPDCTNIGGGFNSCTADPEVECDEQGICTDGCGYHDGNFICVRENDGDAISTEDPDSINDNTGNQGNDDPNTQGDEGTHSRLDGLLKNTDGIEGLLRQIKDGIGDIPGGGGDEEEGDEPCPPNTYKVGDSCEGFPSKTAPEQNDLDTTELDSKIDESKTELTDLYNNIKSEVENLFRINEVTGAYTTNTVTIKGVAVDMGVGRVLDHVNIGSIIIFLCSVWSLFIILGNRGD